MKVDPGVVPALSPLRWRRRSRRVAFQPLIDDEVIVLARPKQSGESLPLHVPLVIAERDLLQQVELVGLEDTCRKNLLKSSICACREVVARQAHAQLARAAGLQIDFVPGSGLRTARLRQD